MRPFLKRAGSKYQIVGRIKSIFPVGERLLEPFVGSSALFLNTEFDGYALSHANSVLIALCCQLQLDGDGFIAYACILLLTDFLNHAFDGIDSSLQYLYLWPVADAGVVPVSGVLPAAVSRVDVKKDAGHRNDLFLEAAFEKSHAVV